MLINEKNESEIIKEFNRIVGPGQIPGDLNDFEIQLGVIFRHIHGRLEEAIRIGRDNLNGHLNKLERGDEVKDFHRYFPQSSGILQGTGPEVDVQVGRLGVVYELLEEYLKYKLKTQQASAEKEYYRNKKYIDIWKEVVLDNEDCKRSPKDFLYLIKALRHFAFVTDGDASLKSAKQFFDMHLGPTNTYRFKSIKLKTYKLYKEFMDGVKFPVA